MADSSAGAGPPESPARLLPDVDPDVAPLVLVQPPGLGSDVEVDRRLGGRLRRNEPHRLEGLDERAFAAPESARQKAHASRGARLAAVAAHLGPDPREERLPRGERLARSAGILRRLVLVPSLSLVRLGRLRGGRGFGGFNPGRLHGAEDRTRLLLGVDPVLAAAVDIHPVEIAVVVDVDRLGILVLRDLEAALPERAQDVLLGEVPFLGQKIDADGHARPSLVAAQVGTQRLEEGRQLVLGPQLVPFILRALGLGSLRIGVVLGVPQAPKPVIRPSTGRGSSAVSPAAGAAPAAPLNLASNSCAELVGLGLGGRSGRALERPIALGGAPGQPRERQGIVGLASKFDDLPLLAPQLIQE